MIKYSTMTYEEKLKLLQAKLLVKNTEKVSIEQLEKDLNMVDMDGNIYKYKAPTVFAQNDCVLFRYDSNAVTSMELSNTIESISEYCPDLNIIFVDKNIPFETHIIEKDDYATLISIISKYFDIEDTGEEDMDDEDEEDEYYDYEDDEDKDDEYEDD